MCGSVSIHAPARGATMIANGLRIVRVFQSTPPRGGRHDAALSPAQRMFSFNPRPRAGGDVCELGQPSRGNSFNPRPRVGGDTGLWGVLAEPQVSIHAPAWGATEDAMSQQ